MLFRAAAADRGQSNTDFIVSLACLLFILSVCLHINSDTFFKNFRSLFFCSFVFCSLDNGPSKESVRERAKGRRTP